MAVYLSKMVATMIGPRTHEVHTPMNGTLSRDDTRKPRHRQMQLMIGRRNVRLTSSHGDGCGTF